MSLALMMLEAYKGYWKPSFAGPKSHMIKNLQTCWSDGCAKTMGLLCCGARGPSKQESGAPLSVSSRRNACDTDDDGRGN